jgi:hypothetical protein
VGACSSSHSRRPLLNKQLRCGHLHSVNHGRGIASPVLVLSAGLRPVFSFADVPCGTRNRSAGMLSFLEGRAGDGITPRNRPQSDDRSRPAGFRSSDWHLGEDDRGLRPQRGMVTPRYGGVGSSSRPPSHG